MVVPSPKDIVITRKKRIAIGSRRNVDGRKGRRRELRASVRAYTGEDAMNLEAGALGMEARFVRHYGHTT